MSKAISNLQQLISKAATQKTEAKSNSEEARIKTDAKKKQQLYSSLPSEINFSKKSEKSCKTLASGEGVFPSNYEKPKAKSYKSLLKMAKTITPAGMLVAKDSLSTKIKESPATTSTKRPFDKGGPISINNPHHPQYQRPDSVGNSSFMYLNQPKSNIHRKPENGKNSAKSKNIPNGIDFIMLQTKKRDLASVEEIHEEILKKKFKGELPRAKSLPPPRKEQIRNSLISSSASEKKHHMSSLDRRGIKTLETHTSTIPSKEGSSRHAVNTRPIGSRNSDEGRADYSRAIQEIFGYNRNKYNDESDDSSDMEANYRDLEREEKKSLRIGKREDLEEEEKEFAKLKRKGLR